MKKKRPSKAKPQVLKETGVETPSLSNGLANGAGGMANKLGSAVRRFLPRALLAPLVLVLAVTLTFWVWQSKKKEDLRFDELRFTKDVEETSLAILTTLNHYQGTLQGTTGLFASSKSVEHHEWRQYVQQAIQGKGYPALKGLGFIQVVSPEDLQAYIAEIRFFSPSLDITPTEREDGYYFVKYLEPDRTMSGKLLGTDVAEDSAVKLALDQSRNQNLSMLNAQTEKFKSVLNVPAVFMAFPIYKNGAPYGNEAERKTALLGWVFSVLSVKELLQEALGKHSQTIDLEIFNGTEVRPETVIYNGDTTLHGSEGGGSALHRLHPLTFGVSQWTLGFTARPEFFSETSHTGTTVILFCGLVISLLLAAVVHSLSTTEARAVKLALQMTAALRESEERFRNMADTAPVLLWTAGTDKQLDYFNRGWLVFTGQTLSDQIQRDGWQDTLHPDDLEHYLRVYSDAFEAQREFEVEFHMRRFDGVYRWMLAKGRPRTMPDGSVAGYIGTCVDITERKRIEEELRRAKEDAEDVSVLKSDFLESVGHEARTMLNTMMALVELASCEPVPTGVLDDLSTLRNCSNSLLTVINDVLDFLRAEAGKLSQQKVSFSLRKSLSGLTRIIEIEAQKKELEILVNVLPAVPDQLRGDPVRLRQALITLLANAIKYTPKTGGIIMHVRLAAQTEDQVRLDFAIADSGVGIAPDKQTVIFDSFNAAETANGHAAASGLGLVIVRRLVEDMGGQISVESKPGVGTAFHVSVTFDKDATDGRRSAQSQLPFVRGEIVKPKRSLKILIAEDNRVSSRLLERLLEKLGHKVQVVENGKEAVERADSQTFDVILMDVRMPEMDGLEATRTIRKKGGMLATIPIIALTAQAAGEDHEKCLEAGMTDYLAKPVDSNELLLKITELTATSDQSPSQQPVA